MGGARFVIGAFGGTWGAVLAGNQDRRSGEPGRFPGRFPLGEARKTAEQSRRPERLSTKPRVATLEANLTNADMYLL